eukprot:TRINITY_DN1235_c0_g1_i3.p1 TRINITY_DN1235_c0_g1~~TRINITY_DN1235_c0_g1_i3.p1  ORF type:complete len:132 (-),score=35.19 TRINITY_DN1235_c0_g1_i3:29-424(-)
MYQDAPQMELPFHGENVDPLRKGILAKKAQPNNAVFHPVDRIQQKSNNNDIALKRFALANMYGAHFPLRLQMEESILSGIQRLPPLHSEFLGLRSLTNDDETIGFEDYLNNPRDAEYSVDLHSVMEAKLGL